MSRPTPPSLTFAEWCKRQGIKEGFDEGAAGWWHQQLKYAGWTNCNFSKVADPCHCPLTACDLARVVLRLPPLYYSRGLPGCSRMWDDLMVWRGELGGSLSVDAKVRHSTDTTTHDEARAVLRFYGEPAPDENNRGVASVEDVGVPRPVAGSIPASPSSFDSSRLTRIEERLGRAEQGLHWLEQADIAQHQSGHSLGEVYERLAALEGVVVVLEHKAAPPSDAKLLDDLRRELGSDWSAQPRTTTHCWVSPFGAPGGAINLAYAALRRHSPRAVADALRLLAGVDA